MSPKRIYYIIFAVSRVTKIETYFRGLVTETDERTRVTNDWTVDKDFATQFADPQLAERVANTFRTVQEPIDFFVVTVSE